MGVGRLPQRGLRPLCIHGIARENVLQDAAMYSLSPALPQLLHTAFGADFGACRDEQFVLGFWADDGADVTPVDHHAGGATRWMAGQIALKMQPGCARSDERRGGKGGVRKGRS